MYKHTHLWIAIGLSGFVIHLLWDFSLKMKYYYFEIFDVLYLLAVFGIGFIAYSNYKLYKNK